MHLPIFIVYSTSIDFVQLELVKYALKHLPQQDITNAMRYKNLNDQALRLSSRLLLNRYCEQQQLEYQGLSHRANGQPISPFDGSISISYTKDRAVVAMSKSDYIGIDIEEYIEDVSGLNDYLTVKEKEIVDSDPLKSRKMMQFWTAKEAVSKALGKGLLLDLKDIDCSKNYVSTGIGDLYIQHADILDNCCLAIAHPEKLVNTILTEVSPLND
jgi:4'-phosphopantetheinyl transferase